MSHVSLERNFSDLLRKSGEVLHDVEDHDVLLRRRDGHDLMLVRADREEVMRSAMDIWSSIAASLARVNIDELIRLLPDTLPWLHVLPPDDLKQFAQEFTKTTEACVALHSFGNLAVLLAQWQNTAYVWSRPEILDVLQADIVESEFEEPVPPPA